MLLTVFIPAYNAMPYLPLAVDSILRQTYGEFKLLIIDDGSTDDTQEYLRSLNDSRVVALRQDNRGLGATANRGLELCDTLFCARMDADDISTPDRLALQMKLLIESPRIGMVGSQISYLADNRPVPALRFPTEHAGICQALLAGRFPLCNPTLLFRTDIARAMGGYRIAGYGEDLDFVLRFSELAEVSNIDRVLLYQRIHSNSASFRFSRHTTLGQRYAILCAAHRHKALPEPAFEDFLAHYEQTATPFGRALDWMEGWSAVQYRQYILDRARGMRLRAACRFAGAALCRPKAIVSRILGICASSHARRGAGSE